MKSYYVKRGFKILELRADQQFEPAQSVLSDMEIELNASIRNEHIPEIKHLNRTMKEQIRSVYTELIRLYGRVPGFLMRELVYAMTFWINRFPAEDNISVTLSP